EQPRAVALPGTGGDRARRVGRRGCARDGQPAVFAELDRGTRAGTRTDAGLLERARVGLDLRGADRQAAGGPRRPDRPAAGDMANAAPGDHAAGRPGGAWSRIRG